MMVRRFVHPLRDKIPDRMRLVSEETTPCSHPECAKPVYWCLNINGNREPLDPAQLDARGRMKSHFATCDFAQDFRRKRAESPPAQEG